MVPPAMAKGILALKEIQEITRALESIDESTRDLNPEIGSDAELLHIYDMQVDSYLNRLECSYREALRAERHLTLLP